MSSSAPILVAVSAGELVDRLTILAIKSERITDRQKLTHIVAELASVRSTATRRLPSSEALDELTQRLQAVNLSLWRIEDELRVCERDQDFGPQFIELARSVYRLNDQRGALKRQINELVGSAIVEEKQYADYS
jgi:hypothetical protein